MTCPLTTPKLMLTCIFLRVFPSSCACPITLARLIRPAVENTWITYGQTPLSPKSASSARATTWYHKPCLRHWKTYASQRNNSSLWLIPLPEWFAERAVLNTVIAATYSTLPGTSPPSIHLFRGKLARTTCSSSSAHPEVALGTAANSNVPGWRLRTP